MMTTFVALQSAIWFYLSLLVLCIQLSIVPTLTSKTLNDTLCVWKWSECKIMYMTCIVGNAIYQMIHTLHFSCPPSNTILNIWDPLQHNLVFFQSKDIPVWLFFCNSSNLFLMLGMAFHLWNNTCCKGIEKNRFLCFSCCQLTAHFWFYRVW